MLELEVGIYLVFDVWDLAFRSQAFTEGKGREQPEDM
jgi:hypothetical protein